MGLVGGQFRLSLSVLDKVLVFWFFFFFFRTIDRGEKMCTGVRADRIVSR